MKFWIVAIVILLSGILYAEESILDVKAPFKKGTIYYEMTGNTKGSEILYIKDWGATTASYKSTETKILGFGHKEKTIEISTPEWDYNFDITNRTGTKQRNPIAYMKEEYAKLSASDKKKFNKNAKEMGLSTVKMFNGDVKENAEKILGFNCDKATMAGTEAYSIHNTNITLKTVSNMMGIKMVVTAVKIDKGKVDDTKFLLPKGITPDYDPRNDEITKQMAKRNIEMVLSGEFKIEPVKNADTLNTSNSKEQEKSQKDFKDAMKKLNNLFGN